MGHWTDHQKEGLWPGLPVPAGCHWSDAEYDHWNAKYRATGRGLWSGFFHGGKLSLLNWYTGTHDILCYCYCSGCENFDVNTCSIKALPSWNNFNAN